MHRRRRTPNSKQDKARMVHPSTLLCTLQTVSFGVYLIDDYHKNEKGVSSHGLLNDGFGLCSRRVKSNLCNTIG